MLNQPTNPGDLPGWRQQMHQHYAESLDAMLASLDTLDQDDRILDDGQLMELGVWKIAALDVDEESIDFGPLFFRPFPAMEDFKELLEPMPWSDFWYKRCTGSSCSMD